MAWLSRLTDGPRPALTVAGACRTTLLALLLCVVSACGGPSAAHTPGHSSRTTATAPPTASASLAPGTVNPAYCGSQDVPIPGAAQALANGQSTIPGITPVQQAWFAMDATTVPACAEVTAHPPQVSVSNFTQGHLSDQSLQIWVKEFEEFWALFEWGQEHGQANFLQFLYGGATDNVVAFVRNGGKIVASPACEYVEKVEAIVISGAQMSSLTNGQSSQSGVVEVDASVGPCTATWTSSSGSTTVHHISAGQNGWELDITTVRTNGALGEFVILPDSYPQGTNAVADSVISEAMGLSR